MDLALNNLQMMICHKTQTTNQPKMENVVEDEVKIRKIISVSKVFSFS